ncbi:unnamed protein product [Plasmodium vivax]|uniref:(malaria parasite P. vivax) hypothetical protein n=1 Tax=Plasmodium vivax TaxID=5855 RepID=A0A8S4H598_PLAVI|nr:unnamed protein product [Plasmodium vivax]
MSSKKLDIAQLRKDYPFFQKIWTLYEEFEENVVDEGKWYNYDTACRAKLGQNDRKNEEYVNFCIKLIRNLVSHSNNARVYTPNQERCNSLNYWIYHNIENLKLSQKFISHIFQVSQDLISAHNNKSICYNLYIDAFKESEKIIKLLYLQDNTDIFLEKMKNKGDEDYCIYEKYIYECVDIYKTMTNSYCSNEDDKLNKHKYTCDTLNTFKNSYIAYLFTKEGMSNKIPSLTDDNTMNLVKCESIEQELEFKGAEGSQPSSFKSPSPQTIVGTMAGASSVLALLYKFTPAGRWIHSGLQGRGGKINNILHEDGANELLLGRPLHEDLISYNIGYEAA